MQSSATFCGESEGCELGQPFMIFKGSRLFEEQDKSSMYISYVSLVSIKGDNACRVLRT